MSWPIILDQAREVKGKRKYSLAELNSPGRLLLMTMNDIERIEVRLERMEGKLDCALTKCTKAQSAIGWIKWVLAGGWGLLLYTVFGHKP